MRRNGWITTALMALVLSGCVGEDGAQNHDASRGFDYQAMMANYADNVFLPTYQNFADTAVRLSEGEMSISQYCEAIGSEEEAISRQRAQSAWSYAMGIWQRAELMQVGPLVANGGALRNRIYSFNSNAPLSECAVDQSVVLATQPDFDLSSRSVNSRGLGALEYLLFSDDLSHHCPSQISETQDWNDLPEQERRVLRCQYAEHLANDLVAASDELLSAWSPDGGDYRFEWVNPVNQEANLKALSDALFYIDLVTKDRKLGVPAGLHSDCNAVACPDAVESPYSERSNQNIADNLDGFREMYQGGSGLGFDDIIEHEGFADIAFELESLAFDAKVGFSDFWHTSILEQAQEQLQSGSDTECRNKAANPEQYPNDMCAGHGYVKRLTDRLRTDFVTIVNLDLPERGQSDND